MAYSLIGKISSTHGLDGRLSLNHNLPKNTFRKLSHIFIEIRNRSYIPYFIEEQKEIAQDTVLLVLDETATVEEAKNLTGKNVYIETELLQKLKPKGITTDLKGFKIADAQHGILGIIEDLFETPGQVLATIQYRGKEVIIPLIDATIQSIDIASQTIKVNLPEGLLDIYLD